MNCHSERVARSCLKLDYLGIVANITSTCVSATYFGLHTHSELASRYISAILLCGAATFWAVLDPNMDGPRAAKLRACIFVALGASGFAPMLHAAVVPGLGMGNFALGHILTASALYLTGTIIYVARFPESSWPGKYNIWVCNMILLLPSSAGFGPDQISALTPYRFGRARAIRSSTSWSTLHRFATCWAYGPS